MLDTTTTQPTTLSAKDREMLAWYLANRLEPRHLKSEDIEGAELEAWARSPRIAPHIRGFHYMNTLASEAIHTANYIDAQKAVGEDLRSAKTSAERHRAVNAFIRLTNSNTRSRAQSSRADRDNKPPGNKSDQSDASRAKARDPDEPETDAELAARFNIPIDRVPFLGPRPTTPSKSPDRQGGSTAHIGTQSASPQPQAQTAPTTTPHPTPAATAPAASPAPQPQPAAPKTPRTNPAPAANGARLSTVHCQLSTVPKPHAHHPQETPGATTSAWP